MSYIYCSHKSAAWVGRNGDDLCSPLGDSWSSHPAGRLSAVSIWRLAHSCVWWLVRSSLGQVARTPTRVVSMWLLGFLTKWWRDSEGEPPNREKVRWEKYLLFFMMSPGGHRRSFLLLSAHHKSHKTLPVSRGAERCRWLVGK